MPRIPLSDLGDTTADRILGHRPELLDAWASLRQALVVPSSTLSPHLKEEVRRTVAQHTGCAYCASLGKPAARQQDEKEALAVAFAEALAAEHTATFQKGLGAVHAMAHPLGALDELPLHHGTLNAVLLPAVLRYNEPAAIEKYDRLRRVTGRRRRPRHVDRRTQRQDRPARWARRHGRTYRSPARHRRVRRTRPRHRDQPAPGHASRLRGPAPCFLERLSSRALGCIGGSRSAFAVCA